MDQLTLSCPACAQPVGEEDVFCEACGVELRAARDTVYLLAAPTAPRRPGDGDTLSLSTGPGAPRLPSFGERTAEGTSQPSSYRLAAPAPQGPATLSEPPATAPAPDPRSGAAEPKPEREQEQEQEEQPTPAPPRGSNPPGATGDFVLAAPTLAPGSAAHPDEDQGAVEDKAETEAQPEPAHRDPNAPEHEPQDHEPADPAEAAEAASSAPPTPQRAGAQACAHCGARWIDADGYCESCGRPLPRPRDHQERALESIAGVTDRGFRHHRNEDAFSVAATRRPNGSPAVVAVVCDGVSSASHPDVASELAAETAAEQLLGALEAGTAPEEAMTAAILAAADAVDALADRTPREPGHNSPACTCVSAVAADGRVTLGWVGDSRAYWFPDDRSTPARRLTVDDSWAARMVEAGLMEEAEAYADPRAHAITGWLGADAVEVDPHTHTFVPPSAGVVLVCTDGLWNYAEGASELAAVVPADARTRPLEAAQELVRFALENGGHDNVTVAVLPWQPVNPPAAEANADPAAGAAADGSASDDDPERTAELPVIGTGNGPAEER